MKRNSVIVDNLIENVMTENIKPSKEYDKLLEKVIKLESEFFKLVGNNKALKDKYTDLNFTSGELYSESEKVLCSECLRLGFMLCLDILGFSQK